jgi:proteasome component ECM29
MIRPRVWAGKADVVKAAVRIAGQWVIVCRENDPVALGWEMTDGTCPWIPICVSRASFGRDLFAGDCWFERRNPETDSSDMECVTSDSKLVGNGDVETDDTEEEAKIDFEECDNILASDVETEECWSSDDVVQSLMFSGLCKALLEQSFPSQSSQSAATDDVLPYRAASLAGLAELLQVLNGILDMDDSLVQHQIALYRMIAPTMIDVIDAEEQAKVTEQKTHPPLIISRSIDCLCCAMWKGIGSSSFSSSSSSSSSSSEEVLLLSETLRAAGGSSAWTVRESSVNGAASLTSKCSVQALRNHRTVDVLLESSKRALGDRKFWRVRYAGLQLLLSLVKRSGECGASFSMLKTISNGSHQEAEQLALEALLPYKETILRLARSNLTDSESRVKALASEVCSAIAWWP